VSQAQAQSHERLQPGFPLRARYRYQAHSGYKVPWILSGSDAYKPSDFQCEVNPNDSELIAAIERKSQNKEQSI
jgi:hypothetical protein